MILVIIGVAVLAVVVVVAVDRVQRVESEIDPELAQRASRYDQFAAAAEQLRDELDREPTVREIYAAVDMLELDPEPAIDLRSRVDRIVTEVSVPPPA